MQHLSFQPRQFAFVLMLAAHFQLAAAQAAAAGPVLVGADLTQANVVKALFPQGDMRDIMRRPPSASLLITFETNSASLTEASRSELDVVAAALDDSKLRRFNFKVEGHADPRGTPQSNLTLSQLRANAVRAYLVLNHAIDPNRLLALGKGDREPLKPQQPAAAENRRVTFSTQPLAE